MPTTLTLPIALPDGADDARAEGHVVLPGRTYADFAALPEGTLAQLFDGLLIMSPAPNVFHQVLVARLSYLLTAHVQQHQLGLVLISPLDVRLGPERVLQPDIVFVAADRLHILGKQEVEGAPDLMVEVLSPSTGTYDLTRKRRLYEEAGVREYWTVDPADETIEVLTLTDDGYRTAVRIRGEGRVASVLLKGFEGDAAALFDWPGGA